MRFGILGPVRAERPDGTPVPLGGLRLRALLAMLLLDADRPIPIDRLIDGLYGEDPPAGAGNALQSQVSRLRQSLPVELDSAGYRLAIPRGEVDAHRFAALAADGHQALASGETERAVTLLRQATGLWRGEPLVDVRDAPFAATQIPRLTEQRLTALEDCFAAEIGLGPLAPASITELRDLIAGHPLRERPRALLMRALTAAGRPAEALTAYEDARRTLADELGADPSPELTALHRDLLRGPASPSAAPAPALPGAASPARARVRHGVPGQLTSFVGRDDELSRVAAVLRTRRLVTLHGPGGAGKTRLAAEAASRYDGDVWFVELADAGPDDVPHAVQAALGLRDVLVNSPTGHPPPWPGPAGDDPAAPGVTDRLVAALADRHLLLVLDNCEHVIAAAAGLTARMLAGAPGLRVLATSREPLRITGEALLPIGGLGVPPAADPVAELTAFPAVRLFADRAADVVPGFTVTAANADAVRRLCRTLDGLPLAVEIAAARLHALPVAEIAARIGDRFRLLSGGSRTAEVRHRTLQAVVAWSWDLLTEPERTLARRFTVFAGGADLNAVERVCGPGTGIVDVLAGLVGKSLIERDGDRYRMLETIRAYCAERLDESGERDRLHRAHAEHFLAFAARADPYLRGSDQIAWLDRLDSDRDNLHAALRRSIAHGAPETALRLVSALSFYWWLRGLRAEAAALAGLALRAAGPEPPPGQDEDYAVSVFTAALRSDVAERPDERWSAYMRALTAPPAQPFLLYLSAMAVGPPDGDPAGVVEMNRQLRAQIDGDPWSRALGGIGAGWMVLFSGLDPALAEPEFAGSLAGFRQIGDRWGAMLALSGLAELASWRGDPAAAIAPTAEALELAGELGSTVDVADLLRGRAQARMDTGDTAGAAADFARVAELARECGAPELIAAALLGLGSIALSRAYAGTPDASGSPDASGTPDREALAESLRYCSEALAACPAGWYSADGTRMTILVVLGRIAEAAGDPVTAEARYREVFRIRGGMIGFQVMAEAYDRLAALAVTSGDAERAARLLGAVRALNLRADAEGSEPAALAAAAARRALGPDRFTAAVAVGAALTAEEAIALPLAGV
ncbi:SARP family transcriptional regulator [Actinoplanes italicus]|uniref:Putative ATPase n=1 Tax=Actinoplanes italicus TaxID=113567 RepID=A0A2T0KCJ8_9ACTN|nr:BTAD domain-containing putative transcriptional regulator [Actinoplanes italicus]PRX20972.1 putative ATPase [Actinoplanes italicus]GIE31447.1 SARP family transcriptional regulator [Actinoplanes italicus]